MTSALHHFCFTTRRRLHVLRKRRLNGEVAHGGLSILSDFKIRMGCSGAWRLCAIFITLQDAYLVPSRSFHLPQSYCKCEGGESGDVLTLCGCESDLPQCSTLPGNSDRKQSVPTLFSFLHFSSVLFSSHRVRKLFSEPALAEGSYLRDG